MAPFPLPLTELMGHYGSYVVYLFIGIAFGAVLEMAGFGKSTKLAAQFYLKDMTVLKVMFTGIVVAMVLVFWATAVGLLEYNLIWVNPTYLWPGIVGGLIMGVGFIVGGFCPGTSLVAAATAKVDGIFFALGTFFGIFMFGETVQYFEGFWNSSFMGRFTLMEWLNLRTGVVVLLVVLMALFMFWGAEQLERIFGDADPAQAPKWRYGAAGTVLVAGVALLIVGQPTNADRWSRIAPEKELALTERDVQIHPGEVLHLQEDTAVQVQLLDVRDEVDFNRFHLQDARHVPVDQVLEIAPDLRARPATTVFVLMSNDEARATEAWKLLSAESVHNLYILGGGVNGWIETFADEQFLVEHPPLGAGGDQLAYSFPAALGARYAAAAPNPELYTLEYTSKVELQIKRGPSSGGCG